MIWQTGRLVSLLAGGLLLDVAGVRIVYVLGGVLLLAAAAVGALAAAQPEGTTGGNRSARTIEGGR